MASQMKNSAPASIHKLVETFEQNLNEYRTRKNETELRREFLDKFFTALGWDVDNLQGAREAEKEVAHEFSVEIDGQQKKADYAFRIKRDSAIAEKFDFLVEAKKPSVKIESDLDAAFQIRRYGWSARIPINILTDFEHFAVYDCRVKPKYGEKAVLNRQMLFHYKEYIEKWDEIVSLFSPEAIRAGSLSEYVKSIKGKKGTADVDDDFLQEIERWRELLAKSIASNNEWIDISGLNYAVQMIIDRIIFLRICEERSIEPENQLQDITNKANIYKELCSLFKRADTKYNSGLFHFAKESGEASRADDLTLRLDIDDKTLKDIILNLYYPKSPCAFLYIPSDILGQVYERFLGKVIRLTDGHRAKVEEKPEVRKAGGVFYTPTFIVTYIVANTIGRLLNEGSESRNQGVGKSMTPADAAKLKIVDPACGSGTFLLGAFEYLLAWHLKWYSENDPEKWIKNKAIVQVGNDYRLTTSKKKEILLNNIYGVDIDAQAVEVTKLSLLLKVLENASGQLELGMERILPDLGDNIKCGNSLVGEDYFDGQFQGHEGLGIRDEERAKVNAFDWVSAFPEVFAQGGFDVVIGNPPYIRIQAMQEWASEQVEYFKRKYKAASKGNYDIYVVFIEKALSLLNGKGRLGFILPSKFFATDYGESIRQIICEKEALSQIVDFGHLQIFEQATTYTCLLFLAGSPQTSFDYKKVNLPDDLENVSFRTIQNSLTSQPWMFSDDETQKTIEKINSVSKPLGELPARIGRGSSSGADDVFMLKKENNELFTRQGERVVIENKILREPVYATDFGRFEFRPAQKEVIIFPYEVKPDGYELLSENKIKSEYPNAYKYLLGRKKELLERKQYKEWYGFSAPRNLDVHENGQILVPLLANHGLYCRLPNTSPNYCLMASGGFSITVDEESLLSPNYVLGLLNSTLLFWRLRSISNVFRGGWITCTKQYVETLPIRTINFNDPAEKSAHDKIVSLVESMLGLHKSLASAQSPLEKERLEKQIKSTDEGIDKFVYELYGLSEEEIKIVES